MITQGNYLDIGNLLINELVGSVALFIIIGLVVISYFGVRFTLPFQVTLFNIVLFVGLTVSFVYNSFVWMLTLFIVGVIVYSFVPKLLMRN